MVLQRIAERWRLLETVGFLQEWQGLLDRLPILERLNAARLASRRARPAATSGASY